MCLCRKLCGLKVGLGEVMILKKGPYTQWVQHLGLRINKGSSIVVQNSCEPNIVWVMRLLGREEFLYKAI